MYSLLCLWWPLEIYCKILMFKKVFTDHCMFTEFFLSELSPFAIFNSLRSSKVRFCIIITGFTIIPHTAPIVSYRKQHA